MESLALRKKLERDHRVIAMAKRLMKTVKPAPAELDPVAWASLCRAAVLGYLFRFWALGRENCGEDNELRGFTAEDVDKEIGFPGFCQLLPKDWLEEREGKLYLPDFHKHNRQRPADEPERLERLRQQARERNRRWREKKGETSRETSRETLEKKGGSPPSSLSPTPPLSLSPSSPKEKKRAKVMPAIPPSLDTPRFREAWALWLEHRQDKRQAVTPASATLAFKKCVEWGVERAVAALEYSIRQGFQGVYEEGGNGRQAAGRVGSDSRLRAEPDKYDGIAETQAGAVPDRAEGVPAEPGPARGADRTLFDGDAAGAV